MFFRLKKEIHWSDVKFKKVITGRNSYIKLYDKNIQDLNDTNESLARLKDQIQEKEQQQEQLKIINERSVEANIAKTRKEQELTEEAIKVRENKLQAEIAKQADEQGKRKQGAENNDRDSGIHLRRGIAPPGIERFPFRTTDLRMKDSYAAQRADLFRIRQFHAAIYTI